jgi:hypothetical protein
LLKFAELPAKLPSIKFPSTIKVEFWCIEVPGDWILSFPKKRNVQGLEIYIVGFIFYVEFLLSYLHFDYYRHAELALHL